MLSKIKKSLPAYIQSRGSYSDVQFLADLKVMGASFGDSLVEDADGPTYDGEVRKVLSNSFGDSLIDENLIAPYGDDNWSVLKVLSNSFGDSLIEDHLIAPCGAEDHESAKVQRGPDFEPGYAQSAAVVDNGIQWPTPVFAVLPSPAPCPPQILYGTTPAGAAQQDFAPNSAIPPPNLQALLPSNALWHNHAPVHPLQPAWRADLNYPAIEADDAFARGLAAGVASDAFARGFAAGAAASAGGIPVSPAPVGTASVGGSSSQKQRRADKIGSGPEHPKSCKWFNRGTCKLGAECRYLHESMGETEVPVSHYRQPCGNAESQTDASNAALPVARAKISLEDALGALGQPHEVSRLAECQIFWCDQRAFKEDSSALKDQLEAETGVSVKTYRTADMCVRLLRKKKTCSANSVTRLFLISWANAQALVPFLSSEPSLAAQVVVLCDTCGNKGCIKADQWALEYPVVGQVATTWPQAVDTLKQFSRSAKH